MAGTVNIPVGSVRVEVFDVDDSAAIFVNGRRVKDILGGQSDSYNFTATQGQNYRLRFEIYNDTGGAWKATFSVTTSDGKDVYQENPSGNTFPGNHIVCERELVLTCK
jgi:hypothetical protein